MSSTPAQTEINPCRAGANTLIEASPVMRTEHREGLLTRLLEQQAAKVPSHVFLFSGFCAMSASLVAELRGNQRSSQFIGMWVGPLLTMGVYNKLVKTFGAR
jgi:hypothetical protein